jgi:hypothetical protein
LPDLFILEALKLNSSELYNTLAASDKYLDINNSGLVPMYQLFTVQGRAPDIEVMNEGRTGLFEIIKASQPVYQQELVTVLFTVPEMVEWKADKSIVMAHNFKTYFIFAEPQGVIAAEDVNQLLNP